HDPEVLPEGVEGSEPVQPGAGHVAVEEQQRGRVLRSGHLPHEGGAATLELDAAPERHRRPDASVVAQHRPGDRVPDHELHEIGRSRLHAPPGQPLDVDMVPRTGVVRNQGPQFPPNGLPEPGCLVSTAMAEMVEFASNGSTARGYLARPDGGTGPGVLVVQEWWGLDSGIKEMADR